MTTHWTITIRASGETPEDALSAADKLIGEVYEQTTFDGKDPKGFNSENGHVGWVKGRTTKSSQASHVRIAEALMPVGIRNTRVTSA